MAIDGQAVIRGLTEHIIEEMDNDDLYSYAYEQMTSYFASLTDCDLLDEASNEGFDVPVEAEDA